MERRHIANFEYDRHEIERAIHFLSDALRASGHNHKPVLLHSIQVGEMLWERGLDQSLMHEMEVAHQGNVVGLA